MEKYSILATETEIAEHITIVSLTEAVVGNDDLNQHENEEDEKLLEQMDSIGDIHGPALIYE